jgi:hypothetical protein
MLRKQKLKAGGKNWSFLEVGINGKWVDTSKGGMRTNIVDVFCIHI